MNINLQYSPLLISFSVKIEKKISLTSYLKVRGGIEYARIFVKLMNISRELDQELLDILSNDETAFIDSCRFSPDLVRQSDIFQELCLKSFLEFV